MPGRRLTGGRVKPARHPRGHRTPKMDFAQQIEIPRQSRDFGTIFRFSEHMQIQASKTGPPATQEQIIGFVRKTKQMKGHRSQTLTQNPAQASNLAAEIRATPKEPTTLWRVLPRHQDIPRARLNQHGRWLQAYRLESPRFRRYRDKGHGKLPWPHTQHEG